MANNQKTDKDGFAVLKTTRRSKYSTIDQFRDGKAIPKRRPQQGPFFNRNAKPVVRKQTDKEEK